MVTTIKRRGFIGTLFAGACAALTINQRSVFAANWKHIDRKHYSLKEYGLGFYLTPELIEDSKEFHRYAESLRQSMLEAVGQHAPVKLWRSGSVDAALDPRTDAYAVTIRTRTGGVPPSSATKWPTKPEGAEYVFLNEVR